MLDLVETEYCQEISNPWLYLNNLHSENTLSVEAENQRGFSDQIDTYLQNVGYKPDTNESVCAEFAEFIRKTESSCFRSDGFHKTDGACTKYSSGLYRHKEEYRKRVWAKIQCLNEWYKQNPTPITMVTFTVYQRELDISEQIDMLKYGFNKAKKMLNKYLGKFPYVWAMEPQQSGAPHIHLIMFTEVPVELQLKVHDLWINKYNPGASIPGHRCNESLQFEISSGEEHLESAAGYVFAYVGKSLRTENLKNRNNEHFLLSAWIWKMSQRNDNYAGVRTWDCSQDLKKIMKLDKAESDIDWFRFSVKVPETDEHKSGWYPLWVDDDMAGYADRIHEFDEVLSLMDQGSLETTKDVIFI